MLLAGLLQYAHQSRKDLGLLAVALAPRPFSIRRIWYDPLMCLVHSKIDVLVDPDGYSQHGQYEGWSSADNCRHFLRCTPRFGRLLPASRPELQKEDGSQTSTVVKGQVLELTGSAADAVTPNEPQSCETEAVRFGAE